MSRLLLVFEQPIIIVLFWTIYIVGILGAARIIGAHLPREGALSGPGDLLRSA